MKHIRKFKDPGNLAKQKKKLKRHHSETIATENDKRYILVSQTIWVDTNLGSLARPLQPAGVCDHHLGWIYTLQGTFVHIPANGEKEKQLQRWLLMGYVSFPGMFFHIYKYIYIYNNMYIYIHIYIYEVLYHLPQNMEYMYRMDDMFQEESTTCLKPSKKKNWPQRIGSQKILPQDPHPEVADQTNFSQQQACVFQPIIRTLTFHGGPSKPNCHVGWKKKHMAGIIPIRFFYLDVAQTLLSQLFVWDPWILNANGCKTFGQRHLFIQKHPRKHTWKQHVLLVSTASKILPIICSNEQNLWISIPSHSAGLGKRGFLKLNVIHCHHPPPP